MSFGGYDKLFWDSATKMMLSSIIILISISISIGLPAKPSNIVEEIQNLNCSLTNNFFLKRLDLVRLCAHESQPKEPSSIAQDLCMAYLELNRDFCKSDAISKNYRSNLFDESTNFNVHDISQYNDSQVDEFLQGLNKRMKDVSTFYKYLSKSKEQLEQHQWAKTFFERMPSEGDCAFICGYDGSNNVKDKCSVLLWARTLNVRQTALESNRDNSFIDSKQQSTTEVLKPAKVAAASANEEREPANQVAAVSVSSPGISRPSSPSLESHLGAAQDSNSSLTDGHNNAADVQKLLSTSSSNDNGQRGGGGGGGGGGEGGEETVQDNRYESVDAEQQNGAAHGKETKKIDEGGEGEGKLQQPKAPANEFQQQQKNVPPAVKEPEPELEQEVEKEQKPEQSHVMSIKDRNEDAAAAAEGQLDSNFNEQQQLLTVANEDKANQAAAEAVNDEFGDGPADEDADDLNPSDIGVAQELPAKQGDGLGVASSEMEEMSVVGRGPIGSDESHFYSYFISMGAILVLLYLMLHYKKKLVALAVEGRRGRAHGAGRRRPNTAAYSKLDSNLEEAMASNMCSQAPPSVTHVLY